MCLVSLVPSGMGMGTQRTAAVSRSVHMRNKSETARHMTGKEDATYNTSHTTMEGRYGLRPRPTLCGVWREVTLTNTPKSCLLLTISLLENTTHTAMRSTPNLL